MSVEIAKRLKFSVNGKYDRAEFIFRCEALIQLLPLEDKTREVLANYIGWARNLSVRERINWGFLPDGVMPYVVRGKVWIVPNGREYRDINGS